MKERNRKTKKKQIDKINIHIKNNTAINKKLNKATKDKSKQNRHNERHT